MGSVLINKVWLIVVYIIMTTAIIGYAKAYKDKMELISTISELNTDLAERKAKYLESEKNLLIRINKQNFIQEKLSKELSELKNSVDTSVEKSEISVDNAIDVFMKKVNINTFKPITAGVEKRTTDNTTIGGDEINSSILMNTMYKVYKGDI